MTFSLLQPLAQVPIAVLDVETTGASAAMGHKVIEIAIVRMEGGRTVARYESLIDPLRPIGAGVTALTGISQSMVTGMPRFADALPAMLPLLQGAALLGHNIPFDLSFLHKEFRRAGTDLVEALGLAPVLDTVRIARRRFGRGGNSLPVLSRRLGIDPVTSHRAMADVLTTAGLFEVLIASVGGWGLCLCDAYAQQGGPIDLRRSAGTDLLPWELEEALDLRRPVMMEYLDARQSLTQRIIEPLHVRRVNGELLLIAHCQLRDDRRTFKVERIVRLSRVDPATGAALDPVSPDVAPAPDCGGKAVNSKP